VIAVCSVEPGGLGQRAGLRPGDQIVSINGAVIGDLVDFQVHGSDPELHMEVVRDGEAYELEVSRRADEPMGLDFGDMKLRRCNNKCVFCFLHQMPRGLRRSLYFEDDDFRLSFLHGSYVTLTNVRQRDLQRIVDQGMSPQYISVHATDPDLRQSLLGRTRPTVPILEHISFLGQHGIEMHAQVVICPGLNDGSHLERTVSDLSRHYPAVQSVALVPVGLTRHRGHLPALDPVTPELAARYLALAREWGDRFGATLGQRFVYAADELFLLTGRLPPARSYYDGFPQIENGIGMVRSLVDTFEQNAPGVQNPSAPVRLALVTGALAAPVLQPLAQRLSRHAHLDLDVVPVTNDFFGHGITVSGLLTGQDMSRALEGGSWDGALLPPNCVNGDGLTLDGLTVPQIEESCGTPLAVGDYDLAGSIEAQVAGRAPRLAGLGRQLSELGFDVEAGSE